MTDQSRTPICDKEWQWATWNGDDFKAVPLDVAIPLELEAADLRERLAKAREALREIGEWAMHSGSHEYEKGQHSPNGYYANAYYLMENEISKARDIARAALSQKGADHE